MKSGVCLLCKCSTFKLELPTEIQKLARDNAVSANIVHSMHSGESERKSCKLIFHPQRAHFTRFQTVSRKPKVKLYMIQATTLTLA